RPTRMRPGTGARPRAVGPPPGDGRARDGPSDGCTADRSEHAMERSLGRPGRRTALHARRSPGRGACGRRAFPSTRADGTGGRPRAPSPRSAGHVLPAVPAGFGPARGTGPPPRSLRVAAEAVVLRVPRPIRGVLPRPGARRASVLLHHRAGAVPARLGDHVGGPPPIGRAHVCTPVA